MTQLDKLAVAGFIVGVIGVIGKLLLAVGVLPR